MADDTTPVRQAVLAEIPDAYSRDDLPELIMHTAPPEVLKALVTEIPEIWSLNTLPSMPSPIAPFRAVEIVGEVRFSASTQHPF